MAANLTTKLGQLVDVLTPDTTNTRIGVANASPTRTLDVTGTFGASGASTLGGALTYGGVTLSNSVTGTGSMVLSNAPTFSGTASFTGAAQAWAGSGQTTGAQYGLFYNNSATAVFGIESSVGGSTISGSSAYSTFSGSYTAKPYHLISNATVAATIGSNGYFGIGMTPSNPLDITSTANGTDKYASLLNAGTGNATANFLVNNGTNSFRYGILGHGYSTSGVFIADYGYVFGGAGFSIAPNGPILFSTNSYAEVARFDTSGRLGIGMTPSNILDITQGTTGTATANITNSTSGTSARAAFQVTSSSGQYANLQVLSAGYTTSGIFTANSGIVSANSDLGLCSLYGVIKFAANGTAEVARVGSDGSFLVGGTTNVGAGYMYASGGIKIKTTGTGLVNTGELFSVNGGSSACIGLLGTVSGTEPLGIANSGADTASYIRFTNNASTTGSITRTGGVTVLNGTSDIRLKIISEHQKNRRAEIEALWIGDFEKFSNFEHSGQSFHSFGIIAQQAHETLGDLSTISPPENENDIWLAPSEPYAYLALWGVKDLYVENEALKARITALENK